MISASQNSRTIFRRAGWSAHIRAVLIVLAGIYVLLGASIWLVEPQLIYHPSPARIEPRQDWIMPVRINTPDGERLTGWYSPAERGCPTFLFFDGNAGRPEIQDGRWRRVHERGAGFLMLSGSVAAIAAEAPA